MNKQNITYLLMQEYYIDKAKPYKDNKRLYYNATYNVIKERVFLILGGFLTLPNAAGLRDYLYTPARV